MVWVTSMTCLVPFSADPIRGADDRGRPRPLLRLFSFRSCTGQPLYKGREIVTGTETGRGRLGTGTRGTPRGCLFLPNSPSRRGSIPTERLFCPPRFRVSFFKFLRFFFSLGLLVCRPPFGVWHWEGLGAVLPCAVRASSIQTDPLGSSPSLRPPPPPKSYLKTYHNELSHFS